MNGIEPELELTVEGTADLITAIAYLIGYHPDDSVVVVGFRTNTVVQISRADLPAPDTSAERLAAMLADAARLAARASATSVTIVGYGPVEAVTPVIDVAVAMFTVTGLPVVDALRVWQGRYYSYLCTDPGCHPPQGTAFDVTSSRLAAEATLSGQVVWPSRAALTAQIAPVTGAAREAMREATHRARQRLEDDLSTSWSAADPSTADPTAAGKRLGDDAADDATADLGELLLRAGTDAVTEAVQRHRRGGRLSDDDAALLLLLLTCQPVRDIAASVATAGGGEHLELWVDLTRRAEPDLVAAPASLLAFTAWRAGNTALTYLALDRALTADPDYRMALLLAGAMRHGIRPSDVDEVFSSQPGASQPPYTV